MVVRGGEAPEGCILFELLKESRGGRRLCDINTFNLKEEMGVGVML